MCCLREKSVLPGSVKQTPTHTNTHTKYLSHNSLIAQLSKLNGQSQARWVTKLEPQVNPHGANISANESRASSKSLVKFYNQNCQIEDKTHCAAVTETQTLHKRMMFCLTQFFWQKKSNVRPDIFEPFTVLCGKPFATVATSREQLCQQLLQWSEEAQTLCTDRLGRLTAFKHCIICQGCETMRLKHL